jgi:hypothetical protein
VTRRCQRAVRLRAATLTATLLCLLATSGAGFGAVGDEAGTAAAALTRKQVACLKRQVGLQRARQLLRGARVKRAEVARIKRCGLRPKAGGGVVPIASKAPTDRDSRPPAPPGLPTLNDHFSRGRCSGRGGTLTAPVAPADEIRHWYPLGGMIGAHVTPISHLYVYYPGELGRPVAPGTHLVRAPAAGAVVQVQATQSDFRVVIEHSCDLYSQFIHLETLAGPLAQLQGKVTPDGGWGGRIPVEAGEVIADDSGYPAFDFGLYDKRVVLPGLLRPATYLPEPWKVHTVDPFPYWPEPIRSEYRAKSLRRTEPLGGKLDWDVAGTARGNWFVEGTNGYAGAVGQQSTPIAPDQQRGYWDTHLALAYDAVDPTAVIVSVGDYGGCACQFAVRGNGPDPLSITPASGIVVYELVQPVAVDAEGRLVDRRSPPFGYRVVPNDWVQGLLALRVNPDGTLTVEKLPGQTSRSAFTGFSSAALTYTR